MEVDVIDDTAKSVKQEANGGSKNPLLKRFKRRHGGIKVHAGTGASIRFSLFSAFLLCRLSTNITRH
jgi:hypothetical protein